VVACPLCGEEYDDIDGFGLLRCEDCGFCQEGAMTVLGGHDAWKTTEPPQFELEAEDAKAQVADEERRERDWHDLQAAASDFLKVYGAAAMVRCVSEALKP
jgi:hypothetical protein